MAMKLLVFGTGQYYMNRRENLYQILGEDEIVAFIDNRITGQEMFDNKYAYRPSETVKLKFDKILLMSAKWEEMQNQIFSLGIASDKILLWDQYASEKAHGKIQIYIKAPATGKQRILIIVQDLGYHGSAIAALYTVKALLMRGYEVLLSAKTGDSAFIQDSLQQGANILICPSFPYIGKEELNWILQFDLVIVNVFPMIRAACEISKYKPVLWWIHEAYESYPTTMKMFPDCMSEDWISRTHVVAVSDIAKRNFEKFFPDVIQEIMVYGIPDEKNIMISQKDSQSKLIFAIIGYVNKVKAQDIFVSAVQRIADAECANAEFWIIGSYVDANPTVKMAKTISQIKLFGVMTREQIRHAFSQIDVLVCPSLEDSMPIVVTESMMHGKVCILSDAVGQAQYVTSGENGIVCPVGNVESLSEKMIWCIHNRNRLKDIGKAARKIYEQMFTMEEFSERLENAILLTKQMYAPMQSQPLI